MAYRNKAYLCFDGDNDIGNYRLMKAWEKNKNINFDFYDAHEYNSRTRDTSLEETIKANLRARLNNSKIFVVLIGNQTRYLYKFVRWEIEEAQKRDLPIVAVNINGIRQMDSDLCPPIVRDSLAIHISFNVRILQYAFDKWPESHRQYRQQADNRAYYYKQEVYTELGL